MAAMRPSSAMICLAGIDDVEKIGTRGKPGKQGLNSEMLARGAADLFSDVVHTSRRILFGV